MFSRARIGLLVVLTGLAQACATARLYPNKHPDPPERVFPGPERLVEIGRRALQKVELAGMSNAPPMETYRIDADVPSGWADEQPPLDTSTRILRDGLASTKHRATRAGRCVAEALADFIVVHGGNPDPDLQSYILGRCRVTWSSYAFNWLTYERRRQVPDAVLVQQAETQLRRMIGDVVRSSNGRMDFGLAVASSKTDLVITIAYGGRQVVLDRVDRSSDGASFTIAGRLLKPDARVGALINQGPYRVAECRSDPSLELPVFSLTCPSLATDDETWIELGAFPEGRFLGLSVASLLVSPSGEPPEVYRAPQIRGAQRPLTSARDLRERILAAVGDLRERAGLEPMKLEVAQVRPSVRRRAGLDRVPVDRLPKDRPGTGSSPRVFTGRAATASAAG